ncbi:redoxin domain-containing protein [Halalkalibacter alkalisediminis]|uniref:Redoxin domain-containing protein n=1 Tax=Halalkalibacter alkalisediminis TaxID=935616 RepID=A0ABV6NAG5_9BACI|nr:redoxin domain-containing protein [Halalkalibacter alkalisediminis]
MVQLQENLELFEGIDADLYAISTDTPANSKSLKEAGAFTFSFLSDQSFEVLEHVNMRNDQMSYRGVSILDKNGNYVFHQVNDHWGEQIEVVASIVVDEFEKMNK